MSLDLDRLSDVEVGVEVVVETDWPFQADSMEDGANGSSIEEGGEGISISIGIGVVWDEGGDKLKPIGAEVLLGWESDWWLEVEYWFIWEKEKPEEAEVEAEKVDW